jgi:sugar phosphate isomerase/epimerase
MRRRHFLAATSATLAMPGWRRFAPPRDKVTQIGLGLYTVRNELERDFAGTLRQVAAMGYREVEFAGYHGRSPGEIRSALAAAGLSAPSAQVTSSELRLAWAARVEQARTVGHHYLVCGWVPPGERRSLADWRLLATLLNAVGQAARHAEMQLAYHNHDFEFAPVNGRAPYDLLLELTDPALVQLELDVYWARKGGRDPLALFARWPGRFPLLHLKDMAPGPRGEFTELGRGVIDFRPILARGRAAGVRHVFVEQDEGKTPALERARIGYDYLKQLEF